MSISRLGVTTQRPTGAEDLTSVKEAEMVVKSQQEAVGCGVLEWNGPRRTAAVTPRAADSCLTGVWAHHCPLIFQMQSLRKT